MAAQPNIFLILTDQQVATALSCAGNTDLATPNLDALAAEGVRFTNAFCTQPLCTPSRASLWSGKMPSELGVIENGMQPGSEHEPMQLGRVFADAGYDCGYAGKWHVPELSVPERSGFRQVHPETEAGITQSCRNFLGEDREQPFFLVASLTEPHGICQVARGQTPPSGPLPAPEWRDLPDLPANYAIPAYEAEMPRIAQRATPHACPTIGWDEGQWRRYRYAYYRLCERADAMVGELLAALDASGHRNDTIVVFSSDHGEQAGAHQWNQKWVLYDESVRVPFIVRQPGHASDVRDELVSVGLDVFPTLCNAAKVRVPEGLRGRDILSLALAEDQRQELYTETAWLVPGIQHLRGRSVRNERYKYTCYAWGRNREQLVDLHDDPGELSNLASSGRHFDLLLQMRELVRKESLACGDSKFAGFVPTGAELPV